MDEGNGIAPNSPTTLMLCPKSRHPAKQTQTVTLARLQSLAFIHHLNRRLARLTCFELGNTKLTSPGQNRIFDLDRGIWINCCINPSARYIFSLTENLD